MPAAGRYRRMARNPMQAASSQPLERCLNPARPPTWASLVQVACAPLLLGMLEVFHPHPDDLLKVDLRLWLFVHFAQIVLFPLAALSVTALVRECRGVAAIVCRVAMFVFAVSFTAFDTAAGVVTGILVKAARESADPQSWRPAIEALWNYPIMGGGWEIDRVPSLAEIGSVALPLGTIAAACALWRAAHRWPPLVLLAVSGFGIGVFDSHSWPGGPLTFGGIGLAGGWLRWQAIRARSAATLAPAGVAASGPVGAP